MLLHKSFIAKALEKVLSSEEVLLLSEDELAKRVISEALREAALNDPTMLEKVIVDRFRDARNDDSYPVSWTIQCPHIAEQGGDFGGRDASLILVGKGVERVIGEALESLGCDKAEQELVYEYRGKLLRGKPDYVCGEYIVEIKFHGKNRIYENKFVRDVLQAAYYGYMSGREPRLIYVLYSGIRVVKPPRELGKLVIRAFEKYVDAGAITLKTRPCDVCPLRRQCPYAPKPVIYPRLSEDFVEGPEKPMARIRVASAPWYMAMCPMCRRDAIYLDGQYVHLDAVHAGPKPRDAYIYISQNSGSR